MKFGSCLLVLAALCVGAFLVNSGYADEGPAMLPLFGDHSRCDACGYTFTEYACYPNGCVKHPGWDFNLSNPNDAHQNVYAPADGIVRDVAAHYPTTWGSIIIEHTINGQTCYTQYGHCEEVFVSVNQQVKKGNRIAKVGAVGATDQDGPHYHLHWELRASNHPDKMNRMFFGSPTYPISVLANVQSWYRDPEPFIVGLDVDFEAALQAASIGSKQGDLHWWYGFDGTDLYASGNDHTARRCYIQNYSGGSYGDCGVVYDALGGTRAAYTVRTGFWSNAQNNGWSQLSPAGPQSSLGMPITNEYNQGGSTARQDFQKGYLYYDGSSVSVHSYPTCAPGWTSSGWNSQYSYLFARAYERNGARNTVGYPTGPVYQYGPYWRQDFTGGTFGNCCIMYDPNNAEGNPAATNEAYLLRSGFYEYYVNQGGQNAFGCPSRDEYHMGDPDDAIQFFVRRVGSETQQHHMYYDASQPQGQQVSWNSTYTQSLVSVTPSAVTNIQQGDALTVEIKVQNTGAFTWHNNSSAYPYDYATLQSCDASGAIVPSFLYDSSWLDELTACTMVESSVAPGQTATFHFTGRVSATAPTGPVSVYFRPVHSVGGLMDTWTTSFEVDLFVESKIVRQLAGDLTGDGLADVVLVTNSGVYLYRNTGSSFVNDGRIDAWTPNDRPTLLADVLGQGRCQLISWGVDGVHCQIYDSGTNPKLGGPIRLSYWSPALDWRVKAGDVDNNGTADLVIQTPAQLLTQRSWWSGSYDQQLHLQTWANWSSYPYQHLVGDFDPDGQADVLFSIPNDRVYYKYSTGSTFGPNIVLRNWSFASTDSLFAGRFTDDGRVGILGITSSGCSMLVPSGSGYVGPFVWNAWAPYPYATLIGDVNADGLDDVIAVFTDLRKLSVLLNDSGDRFSGPFTWYEGSGSAQPMRSQPTKEPIPVLSFSLVQNPANGQARFHFSLPEAASVSLDIYDVQGQRVESMAQYYSAGSHDVSWQTKNQAPGVYFVRFRTKGLEQTRKLVFVR